MDSTFVAGAPASVKRTTASRAPAFPCPRRSPERRPRDMSSLADVVILGAGYTGTRVARLARSRGLSVVTTVRSPARAAELSAEGFEVIASDVIDPDVLAPRTGPDTHLVVCFQADGETDQRLSPRFSHAGSIVYVSSTGVYGPVRGIIDDSTALPARPSDRSARLLAAEDAWRNVGATVLRAPGIYGADRGLHLRVARGEHRIPGDGTTFTSRIHVEDLAELLLAARNVHGATFVVGDRSPATQNEIVGWIAAEYGVPMPSSVPAAEVHETLRADRQIDGSRALEVLGVSLRYPHYRDGMDRRGG